MASKEETIRMIINECHVRFNQEKHSFEEVIKFAISEAKVIYSIQRDATPNCKLKREYLKCELWDQYKRGCKDCEHYK